MLIMTENGLPVRGMRGRNGGASLEDRQHLIPQRFLGGAVEKAGEIIDPGHDRNGGVQHAIPICQTHARAGRCCVNAHFTIGHKPERPRWRFRRPWTSKSRPLISGRAIQPSLRADPGV